jgi:hypothetical protein
MKIQGLYDIDQSIKVNDLKEVTSSRIYLTENEFHPQGLFSEEIFGQTNNEREYRCGYIKLPIHIFNPNIAKTIILRSGGILKKMAYAETRCSLTEDGILKADEEGQYCGLVDLYNIWEKIDIRKTLNTRSKDNLDILTKIPKKLLFNDKVLVAPPNMRPVGERNGRQVKSELNTIYIGILGLKSVTARTTTKDVYQVYAKFQNYVVQIYEYINNLVSSKTGFFQQHLMSKVVSATARNVISGPKYNTDNPLIGIYHTGYPMHTLLTMFEPFVKFQMKQFFEYSHIQQIHPNPDEINSEDLLNIYDDEMITNLCNVYKFNPGARFRIMYLDPDHTKPILFDGIDLKNNTHVNRPLTLTDVIFICCQRGVIDAKKMVYTCRYPMGDHYGAFFTYPVLLSTIQTTEMQWQSQVFQTYPVIDPSLGHMKVSTLFADTLTPSNSRLKAIGGDYDGDTVKSTGIWSDEANEEAERLMKSKLYNIRMEGRTMFPIEIECLNGLYGLTKME